MTTHPDPARVAEPHEREPMSEAQPTDDELLRSEQAIRELFARDGKARPSIRVLLMQIDRLREAAFGTQIILESTRDERERLSSEIDRLRGWLREIADSDCPKVGSMNAVTWADDIRAAVSMALKGNEVPDDELRGFRMCPECDGAGLTDRGQECIACDGTGSLEVGPDER